MTVHCASEPRESRETRETLLRLASEVRSYLANPANPGGRQAVGIRGIRQAAANPASQGWRGFARFAGFAARYVPNGACRATCRKEAAMANRRRPPTLPAGATAAAKPLGAARVAESRQSRATKPVETLP